MIRKQGSRRQGHSRDEPNSIFKVARTVACIYLSVSIPLRIAFYPQFQIAFNIYSILDLHATIIFTTDAVRSYYRNKQYWIEAARISPIIIGRNGESACRGTGIAESLCTSGIPDHIPAWNRPTLNLLTSIIAILPLEYLTLLEQHNGFDGLTNYLMLNRIIIILRLPKYIDDLADFFESHGLKSIGVQRAWKLFFAMALAGHWCCCGFFLVGKVEANKGGDLTWSEDLDLIQTTDEKSGGIHAPVEDCLNAYIQSLYWAYITMVSIVSLETLKDFHEQVVV